MSDGEASAATEEFLSFVVDVRARHSSSSRRAEDIVDVVSFLLADYGFFGPQKLVSDVRAMLSSGCAASTEFPCSRH